MSFLSASQTDKCNPGPCASACSSSHTQSPTYGQRFWAFIRSFGTVGGVAISGAIFNAQTELLSRGSDIDGVQEAIRSGAAYQHATMDFLDSVTPEASQMLQAIFSRSLKTIWYAALAFALAGFLGVFFEEEMELRTHLKTDFGLAESQHASK